MVHVNHSYNLQANAPQCALDDVPEGASILERPLRQQPRRFKVSQDVRDRFLQCIKTSESTSVSAAARMFGLPISTAHAIARKHDEFCEATSPRVLGRRPHKITQTALTAIAGWIDQRPDLTLHALCSKLLEAHSITVTQKTMSQALTKIGFTIKILRAIPISRNSPDVVVARRVYAQMFLSDAPPDRRNIVWVDETGFNLHLRRKYGRARKGDRASIVVSNSRGRNISVCAAMSEDGLLHELLRPGSFNAEHFCHYLEGLFVILCELGRSECWIILDNARFHHCAIVQECATRHGHSLVFLPPYSPMLNPIESLFGKWKTHIRTQGVSYQQDELLRHMATARYEITIPDCLGWIRDVSRNIGLSLVEHIFE